MHTSKDYYLINTLRFVSAIEATQIYGAILLESLTSPKMKETNAYKTYLSFATGATPPKKVWKFKKPASPLLTTILVSLKEPTKNSKRVKRSAKKSSKALVGGVFIRETLEIPLSKKEEKVDVARGKGIELLSEVALTEEAQFEEGNDEDDRNNEQDSRSEGCDEENDSDNKNTQFNSEKGSNSEHETNENESDSESNQDENEEDIGDDDKEEEDKFVRTPSNDLMMKQRFLIKLKILKVTEEESFESEAESYENDEDDINNEQDSRSKGSDEENDSDNKNTQSDSEKGSDFEHETDENESDSDQLYDDVDIWLNELVDVDEGYIQKEDAEIVSPIDVHIHHEVPSQQTPTLLTIPVSILKVAKEESSESEAESRGNDEDDRNNEQDSRSEGNENEEEIGDDDEEEKDEFVRTPSNNFDDETKISDKAEGDEDEEIVTTLEKEVVELKKDDHLKTQVTALGNDEDDINNEQDSRSEESDEENDSDNKNTQSDIEKGSDFKHETDIFDKAEGDEDKEMDYTTSQQYDDVDIWMNEPVDANEGFIQKEGTNDEIIYCQSLDNKILKVIKEESSESEAESRGNDEDDRNNEQDSRSEGSDEENDSDNKNNQSDGKKGSDFEHETIENESDFESDQDENEEEIGDDDKEEEDEFVRTHLMILMMKQRILIKLKLSDKAEGDEDKEMDYTTSQQYDDVDIRMNEPVDANEGFIQKEGTNDEMIYKNEVPVTSSSHSSDLASKFLNFSYIPHTEAEIVSPMDAHVHHEVPSQQTSTLLTILKVTKEESSESEATSRGNDEDDINNEQDSRSEGSDEENDSDNKNNQSDGEKGLDFEHETIENESDSESDQDENEEEIGDDDEEEEDEFVRTPSNDFDDVTKIFDKAKGDEDEEMYYTTSQPYDDIFDKAKGDEDKEMDYTTSQLYDDIDIWLNEPVDADEGFIQKEEESYKSEAESWGNDKDDRNNEQDSRSERSDEENDSDNKNNQSDGEKGSDSEHETIKNESDFESDQDENEEEIGDDDEEEEDEFVRNPSNDFDDETKIFDNAEGDEDEEIEKGSDFEHETDENESDSKSDQDQNKEEIEDDEEEEENEFVRNPQLYDDVDIWLNEPVDADEGFIQKEGTNDEMIYNEVPVTISSHSSDLASKFLNFSYIPDTDAEIVSLMDVHVHHEVPSQQTPILLTVPVSSLDNKILIIIKEESSESEAESQGNDEDDRNNKQDSRSEGSDEENDSDNKNNQSDGEKVSDSEHETIENESDSESDQDENEEEIGDDHEEDED
nr:hypothetical protein [Tanacetum cinerariifolium]